MELLQNLLGSIGAHSIRPHLSEISAALTATTLAVFGGDINTVVRNAVQKYNFVVRLLIFVAVCAFGYGLLAVVFGRVLSTGLSMLGNVYLAPIILLFLVVLGLLAGHRKRI